MSHAISHSISESTAESRTSRLLQVAEAIKEYVVSSARLSLVTNCPMKRNSSRFLAWQKELSARQCEF